MNNEKIDLIVTNTLESIKKNMNTKHELGQYFTTNNILQEKVFQFILNNPENILEPSVGQGDLVKFVQDKRDDILFEFRIHS